MNSTKITSSVAGILVLSVVLGVCAGAFGQFGDVGKALDMGKKVVEKDKADKEKKEQAAGQAGEGQAAPAAGKAEPGNIVFSKSPINPDKPENLTASFQAGDAIYAVAYPTKSFKDMAKESSSIFVEIKGDLDGTYDHRAGFSIQMKGNALDKKVLVLDVAPAADKLTAYDDPNMIYKEQFEKMGKKGGPMQLTKFLSQLPSGKHTIKLTLYYYADMAVGTFTIEGQDFKAPYEKLFAAYEAKDTAGVKLPEAKMDDKKLEGEMVQALKNSQVKEAKDGEILQIVIIDPDWFLERHAVSGAILFRYIRTQVVVKDPGGKCWNWRFVFKQDYIGDKFEKTKLHGIGDRVEIPEANVQKETFE